MTNDSKEVVHTPTPWKEDGSDICEITSPGFIHVIAEVEEWKYFDIENFCRTEGFYVNMSCPINPKGQHYLDTELANAEYIVKCVNNHDALIDTLNYAKSTLRGMNLRDDADKIIRASCLSQIKIALTQAGA